MGDGLSKTAKNGQDIAQAGSDIRAEESNLDCSAPNVSRRSALVRAGWVVPTVVALKLPKNAFAQYSHGDQNAHVDEPATQHVDNPGQHTDQPTSNHSDTPPNQIHGDLHNDIPHTDENPNLPHGDANPHTDLPTSHQDSSTHLDFPSHSDRGHSDCGFCNFGSHADSGHSDTHGDSNPHFDVPATHTDFTPHADSGHIDIPHDDLFPHQDGSVNDPFSSHSDTVTSGHNDTPAQHTDIPAMAHVDI